MAGGLSYQELQCLRCLSVGMDITETANTLGISRDSARSYLRRAMRHLDAKNWAHAVALAIRGGQIR